jgi:hypothetical protein
MPEHFFDLSLERRRSFLDEAGRALERNPVLLEKDIWVCWALQTLFALPTPTQPLPLMVFKGGTSLSKVYRAIQRFSEDIDITLDHRSSGDPLHDPVTASGNQRSRFAERMKQYTADHVAQVIKPHFERSISSIPVSQLEIAGEELEQLIISYSSPYGDNYVLPRIKLEFGSKNATEPHEIHLVQPDILAWQPAKQLEFPHALVAVLSAERTFWEKATLIHAEVTRRNRKLSVERYSRHWYDLAQLLVCGIAEKALVNHAVRDSVIQTKTALFAVAGVDYQEVSSGSCRLVDHALDALLERDFEAMIDAGMFEGKPPKWSEVMEHLGQLERQINTLEH